MLWVAMLAHTIATMAADPRPNIIFIMSDDQDGNRVRQDYADYLPTHRYLRDHGITFINHCADSPQCGPSRAATLTGRLPQNNGYLVNGDPSGRSRTAWMRLRNNTIGTFLTKAGYHTVFAGKWVNGDGCSKMPLDADGQPTWSYWAQLCNTYNLYNSSYADPHATGGIRIETDIHQSDSLANQSIMQMREAVAAGKPFYLHLTPVAPHESTCYGCAGRESRACASLYPQDGGEIAGNGGDNYGLFGRPCPAKRHRHLFLNLTMPRVPSWNRTSNAPVSFNAFAKPINEQEAIEIERTWITRLQALMSVDEMVEKILHEVRELGVEQKTFVFYTSDNVRAIIARSKHTSCILPPTDLPIHTSAQGWHLGEHLLPPFNKREPYDTDVQLPLYVTGPNITRKTLVHPSQHTDLSKTFLHLAQAQAHAPYDELDGMSMVPLLAPTASNSTSWRQHSIQQFHEHCNTWISLRVANTSHTSSFRLWCTNQTEYYDLRRDPFELDNMAEIKGEHSPGEFSRQKRLLVGLSTCEAHTCRRPVPWSGAGQPPYPPCYLGLCTHKPKLGQCGHYVTKEPGKCRRNP